MNSWPISEPAIESKGAIMSPFAEAELNKVIERTLKDAGLTRPPVRLEDVLAHLELFKEFYDLTNPSFLDRAKHRIVVGGHRLAQIVRKIKLQAILFFDESRIVVDETLPVLKREWPAFHEAGHRICPGHQEVFAFGDTAQTLHPTYHEKLEAEANFAGAGLMFCGKRFTEEAADTAPSWETIEALADRFGRTKTTTLRRYAEFGPNSIMAAMIGTPAWKFDADYEAGSCRHFVVSLKFGQRFSGVNATKLFEEVNAHCKRQRGGKVANFELCLTDDNGEPHEFLAVAFCNTHDLLVLLVHRNKLSPGGTIVVPDIATGVH